MGCEGRPGGTAEDGRALNHGTPGVGSGDQPNGRSYGKPGNGGNGKLPVFVRAVSPKSRKKARGREVSGVMLKKLKLLDWRTFEKSVSGVQMVLVRRRSDVSWTCKFVKPAVQRRRSSFVRLKMAKLLLVKTSFGMGGGGMMISNAPMSQWSARFVPR